MLLAAAALAAFVITGLQHTIGYHPSSSLSAIFSLIFHPEISIIITSIVPVFLSIARAKFDVNIDGLEPRQDISPIPLLDLLHGPYCKSLDPFKPVDLQPKPDLTLDGFYFSSTGMLNISSEPAGNTWSLDSEAPQITQSRLHSVDPVAEFVFIGTPVVVKKNIVAEGNSIIAATPTPEDSRLIANTSSKTSSSFDLEPPAIPASSSTSLVDFVKIKLYDYMPQYLLLLACLCSFWLLSTRFCGLYLLFTSDSTDPYEQYPNRSDIENDTTAPLEVAGTHSDSSTTLDNASSETVCNVVGEQVEQYPNCHDIGSDTTVPLEVAGTHSDSSTTIDNASSETVCNVVGEQGEQYPDCRDIGSNTTAPLEVADTHSGSSTTLDNASSETVRNVVEEQVEQYPDCRDIGSDATVSLEVAGTHSDSSTTIDNASSETVCNVVEEQVGQHLNCSDIGSDTTVPLEVAGTHSNSSTTLDNASSETVCNIVEEQVKQHPNSSDIGSDTIVPLEVAGTHSDSSTTLDKASSETICNVVEEQVGQHSNCSDIGSDTTVPLEVAGTHSDSSTILDNASSETTCNVVEEQVEQYPNCNDIGSNTTVLLEVAGTHSDSSTTLDNASSETVRNVVEEQVDPLPQDRNQDEAGNGLVTATDLQTFSQPQLSDPDVPALVNHQSTEVLTAKPVIVLNHHQPSSEAQASVCCVDSDQPVDQCASLQCQPYRQHSNIQSDTMIPHEVTAFGLDTGLPAALDTTAPEGIYNSAKELVDLVSHDGNGDEAGIAPLITQSQPGNPEVPDFLSHQSVKAVSATEPVMLSGDQQGASPEQSEAKTSGSVEKQKSSRKQRSARRPCLRNRLKQKAQIAASKALLSNSGTPGQSGELPQPPGNHAAVVDEVHSQLQQQESPVPVKSSNPSTFKFVPKQSDDELPNFVPFVSAKPAIPMLPESTNSFAFSFALDQSDKLLNSVPVVSAQPVISALAQSDSPSTFTFVPKQSDELPNFVPFVSIKPAISTLPESTSSFTFSFAPEQSDKLLNSVPIVSTQPAISALAQFAKPSTSTLVPDLSDELPKFVPVVPAQPALSALTESSNPSTFTFVPDQTLPNFVPVISAQPTMSALAQSANSSAFTFAPDRNDALLEYPPTNRAIVVDNVRSQSPHAAQQQQKFRKGRAPIKSADPSAAPNQSNKWFKRPPTTNREAVVDKVQLSSGTQQPRRSGEGSVDWAAITRMCREDVATTSSLKPVDGTAEPTTSPPQDIGRRANAVATVDKPETMRNTTTKTPTKRQYTGTRKGKKKKDGAVAGPSRGSA